MFFISFKGSISKKSWYLRCCTIFASTFSWPVLFWAPPRILTAMPWNTMRRAWTTYCFGKSWNAAALNLHGPSGCLNGMQTCRCRCHDSRLDNVRIRWAESMANEIPKEKPQHYNVTTAFHCTSSKLTVHADRIGGHPSLLWPFWRQHGIANLFTSIFAWVLPSHFLIPSSHPISHIPYPISHDFLWTWTIANQQMTWKFRDFLFLPFFESPKKNI